MYDIRLDREKNRLYVRLGAIDTGEGERFFNEIKAMVAQLAPGFSAVSDIREFSFADPEEGRWAEKILPFLADAGMAAAARVTGKPATSLVRQEPRFGYSVVMADTGEDADETLDKLVSRDL